MKIGIVVATKRELGAFLDVFGHPLMYSVSSYLIYSWRPMPNKEIYAVLSGVGEIAAAASTQYLIDEYQVDRIINYGVVGGLVYYENKKPFLVDRVVHYDFDMTFGTDLKVGQYPESDVFIEPEQSAFLSSELVGIDRLACASADKIVGGGEPKKRLRREFKTEACDMESAGILITCNRNRIPCTIIKAISDGLNEDVEAFERNADEAARNCVELINRLIHK